MKRIVKTYGLSFLFALLVTGVIAVPMVSAQTSGTASLSLSPTTGTYEEGDQFMVSLTFDSNGHEVDAVDAVIDYDPDALTVASVQTTNLFAAYPASSAASGVIRISGLAPINQPFTGSGVMATITFTVIGGASNSSVAFVYGNDTGSLVAEHDTAQNVLGARTDAGFVLQAAAPTATPVAPTATPTPLVEALPTAGVTFPTLLIALFFGLLTLIGITKLV